MLLYQKNVLGNKRWESILFDLNARKKWYSIFKHNCCVFEVVVEFESLFGSFENFCYSHFLPFLVNFPHKTPLIWLPNPAHFPKFNNHLKNCYWFLDRLHPHPYKIITLSLQSIIITKQTNPMNKQKDSKNYND